MNRRLVAIVLVAMLVLGTLGGVAAVFGSTNGSSGQASSGESDAWGEQARSVYNSIGPVTDRAGQAIEQDDDAAYAAANAEIAGLLDGMPLHPNNEVNAIYAAIAQAHREIAADADIDGQDTITAQDRVIVLLERAHELVPPF